MTVTPADLEVELQSASHLVSDSVWVEQVELRVELRATGLSSR